MTRMYFKSIRSRLTFWFLLVSLLPLAIFGVFIYMRMEESNKKEAFNKLIAIRDLKAQQLNAWLTERISDMSSMSENYETN